MHRLPIVHALTIVTLHSRDSHVHLCAHIFHTVTVKPICQATDQRLHLFFFHLFLCGEIVRERETIKDAHRGDKARYIGIFALFSYRGPSSRWILVRHVSAFIGSNTFTAFHGQYKRVNGSWHGYRVPPVKYAFDTFKNVTNCTIEIRYLTIVSYMWNLKDISRTDFDSRWNRRKSQIAVIARFDDNFERLNERSQR